MHQVVQRLQPDSLKKDAMSFHSLQKTSWIELILPCTEVDVNPDALTSTKLFLKDFFSAGRQLHGDYFWSGHSFYLSKKLITTKLEGWWQFDNITSSSTESFNANCKPTMLSIPSMAKIQWLLHNQHSINWLTYICAAWAVITKQRTKFPNLKANPTTYNLNVTKGKMCEEGWPTAHFD